MTTKQLVATIISTKAMQKEFEDHLATLKRRIERIQAARRRDLAVKKTHVDAYWIKRHKVAAHDRNIIVGRTAKVATVRKAA